MKSAKRAQSKKVPCEICGEYFHARGLKSHIRLLHQLKITEVFTQVKKPILQSIATENLLKLDKMVNNHSSNLSNETLIPINHSETSTFKAHHSKYDEYEITPEDLLELEFFTNNTKANLSKEIEIPTDYLNSNTSNHSCSSCDGCDKITAGITEFISPNGEWLFYLCRKCKNDHHVMVNLAKELMIKANNIKKAS